MARLLTSLICHMFHALAALTIYLYGRAGVIVVDDPLGSLSPELEALRATEQVMLLQSVELFNYTQLDLNCPPAATGEGGLEGPDGSDVTGSHLLAARGAGGTVRSRCFSLDGSGSLFTMSSRSGDTLPLELLVNQPLAGNPISGDYFTINGAWQPQMRTAPCPTCA